MSRHSSHKMMNRFNLTNTTFITHTYGRIDNWGFQIIAREGNNHSSTPLLNRSQPRRVGIEIGPTKKDSITLNIQRTIEGGKPLGNETFRNYLWRHNLQTGRQTIGKHHRRREIRQITIRQEIGE